MGPVERELRKHPGPKATDADFYHWAWTLETSGIIGLGIGPFDAVSNVYVRIGKRRCGAPGFGITLHTSKRRIRDAISEAIEAAEALGL